MYLIHFASLQSLDEDVDEEHEQNIDQKICPKYQHGNFIFKAQLTLDRNAATIRPIGKRETGLWQWFITEFHSIRPAEVSYHGWDMANIKC